VISRARAACRRAAVAALLDEAFFLLRLRVERGRTIPVAVMACIGGGSCGDETNCRWRPAAAFQAGG
jgi:hypothetical protein